MTGIGPQVQANDRRRILANYRVFTNETQHEMFAVRKEVATVTRDEPDTAKTEIPWPLSPQLGFSHQEDGNQEP